MMYTRSFLGHALCLPRQGEEHKLPTNIFVPAEMGISGHHRRLRFPAASATTCRIETRVMGSVDEEPRKKKPRVLCLHGYRTSGEIMSSQVKKWPAHLIDRLDLVFPDAPHPAEGRSEVDGIFPPPYYEWFHFTKGYKEYSNHRECLAFIEEYMVKHGPFDGLMGFSQGALVSDALVGLQSKGLFLKKIPAIKFVVLISGAKFNSADIIARESYSAPLNIPSLHFLGEKDFVRRKGVELLKSYVDPFVIHHSKGHIIPKIDEKGEKIMMKFITKIENVGVVGIHPIVRTIQKSDTQGLG